MTNGNQPEPWRSNVMSRTWRGSWSQKRRKLVRWSSLRRSMNLGQGAAGVGGELVEGSPSLATGMLSCRAWTSVVWVVGRSTAEGS